MGKLGEKKFEDFCKKRQWRIYKIPELSGIQTPDFFVVAHNKVFICEIKNLSKSGAERKDITEFKNKKGNIVGVHFDYNKEIDTIAEKINKANQQFKSTVSFNVPQVLIISSDRFCPLDKNIILKAMYGKIFQRLRIKTSREISKNTSINLPPLPSLITDRTLRKDKNILVSAVVILNKQDGMFLLHNLWASVPLPISIFNGENDINYLPEEITFKEIKGN